MTRTYNGIVKGNDCFLSGEERQENSLTITCDRTRAWVIVGVLATLVHSWATCCSSTTRRSSRPSPREHDTWHTATMGESSRVPFGPASGERGVEGSDAGGWGDGVRAGMGGAMSILLSTTITGEPRVTSTIGTDVANVAAGSWNGAGCDASVWVCDEGG